MTRRATLQTCVIAVVFTVLSVPLFAAALRKPPSILLEAAGDALFNDTPAQEAHRRKTLAAQLMLP